MADKRRDRIQRALNRGLILSLILHVCIAMFVLFQWLFFTEDRPMVPPALRVTMVDLPEKKSASLPSKPNAKVEEKKPELPEEKKPELPPKEEERTEMKLAEKAKEDSLKKKKEEDRKQQKKKQEDALRKLEAAEAFANLEKPEPKKPDQEKGPQVQEGEVSGALDFLQRQSYEQQVEAHAKNHWELPKWLSSRKLQATVVIKVDANGNVIDRKILSQSGNPLYDSWVLESVDGASPYPAPPAKLASRVASEGIVLAYP